MRAGDVSSRIGTLLFIALAAGIGECLVVRAALVERVIDLQAGHFNDFVQVLLLRGALLAAINDAPDKSLIDETLTQRVFDQLHLADADFSANPNQKGVAADNTRRALRDVLGYRLYFDLRRGWRITNPNIEQLGLLAIDYLSLDECCTDREVWSDAPDLGSLLPDGRERRDFGLVRRFAGRDIGDHPRVARRAIGVGTEREVFSDGLADHFQLGLGTGALGDGGFDRLLLPLARRVETGAPRVERVASLLQCKPFGIDLSLARKRLSAGRRKRRLDRRFDLRERRLDVGAGGSRVFAGLKGFELGENSPSAVFRDRAVWPEAREPRRRWPRPRTSRVRHVQPRASGAFPDGDA
jgi:hypothetical protein